MQQGVTVLAAGFSILAAALALNYLATRLGLATWYDFVKRTNQIKIGFWSYIWLFLIYPASLGAVATVVVSALSPVL